MRWLLSPGAVLIGDNAPGSSQARKSVSLGKCMRGRREHQGPRAGGSQHVPAGVQIISSEPIRAGALFILVIMSSSICCHFPHFLL